MKKTGRWKPVFLVFKNSVLPAWELNLNGFFCFTFCVFLGATLKIAVLHAWEFNFGEVDLQFYFFVIFENAKKTGFRQPRFFTFFHYFWYFLGGLLALFWRPFGVSGVFLARRCPPFGFL